MKLKSNSLPSNSADIKNHSREEDLARNNSSEPFVRDYELTRDGYLLVPHGEGKLLVDTGAPQSFGRGLEGVPGVPKNPPISLAEGLTIEWLVEHIHHQFDGLIGAEILHHCTLVIDPIGQRLELSTDPIDQECGVPIRHEKNVPIFDGTVDGSHVPIIFDTGAPLGFVPTDMVHNLAAVDRISEFYPMVGPFETDVYELPLEIGNTKCVLPFGTFPERIEQMHAQAGMSVLIGLGLLAHYRISIGLREQRMLLEPV